LPHIAGEVRIEGESHIPELAGRVRRVWMEPNNPPGFPDSVRAILSADMIVIGPGSLYTSILPNLLVPDLVEAIRSSRAMRVFVCNVATQPGETDSYTAWDHVRAVEEHVGQGLFDLVLVNRRTAGKLGANSVWVTAEDDFEDAYALYQVEVVDEERPWRHDSKKLARVLMDLLQEKTGPLVE
jgi:uncharacterized cofD-like protein